MTISKLKMIELLNDDLKNEWKHLRFYLYHASAVTGLHCGEYKELFLEEAASEMKHVTQFSDLIIGLGGTATFESNDFEKFHDPKSIMNYAVKMEEQVIENYFQRMQDASELSDKTVGFSSSDLSGDLTGYPPLSKSDASWIQIFLEGQLEASREDVDHFKQILRGL